MSYIIFIGISYILQKKIKQNKKYNLIKNGSSCCG